MAHEIDMSNNRPNMAYVGETPWHGLGAVMPENADLDQWRIAAGLDWHAQSAPVKFHANGEDREFANRLVLYRSDTAAPLGVVSPDYCIVQPREVIDFYRDLCKDYGFKMETAGCLKGGKVIWALARTGFGSRIKGQDEINGYLLLTTSFDKTLSTQGRFTSVRVVCNNTLTMAVHGYDGDKKSDIKFDESGRASLVKVAHSQKFKADEVKLKLQVGDVWERWIEQVRRMADCGVTTDEAVKFFLQVYHGKRTDDESEFADLSESNPKWERTMARLGAILQSAPGHDLRSSKGTVWGLVNAVTRDVDFSERAHSDDSRLTSAWYGPGEQRKLRAWELAGELLLAKAA